MAIHPNLRRVLLGCVLSNALIGAVGLSTIGNSTAATTTLAANCAPATGCQPVTSAQNVEGPTTTVAAPTTVAPVATTAAPTTAQKISSKGRASTRTSTSTAAVAADDVTGIASSAAPPTQPRIAPTTGTYPVSFSGSASVDGKAQKVPSSGSLRLSRSGDNIEQSSPDAPGDLVILQHYGNNESTLVSLQMTANNTTKTFAPSSGATYLQYNSPSGTSWNWSATSTDGKTQVQASGTVGGTSNMVINGQNVATVQMTTTLTLSGDINGTAKLVTWASPAYRVPVRERAVINATAKVSWSSVRLVSDVTTTLSRLSPN